MEAFFQKIRPLLEVSFKFHDVVCDFIARYFMLLKKVILLIAFFLSLELFILWFFVSMESLPVTS
jgi:hypothetical protein